MRIRQTEKYNIRGETEEGDNIKCKISGNKKEKKIHKLEEILKTKKYRTNVGK